MNRIVFKSKISWVLELSSLLGSEDSSDLEILCGDIPAERGSLASAQRVLAHKCIIAAICPALRDELAAAPHGSMATLILPDTDACAVRSVLSFVYNGSVICDKDQYKSIVQLMELLCMEQSQAATFKNILTSLSLVSAVNTLPEVTPLKVSVEEPPGAEELEAGELVGDFMKIIPETEIKEETDELCEVVEDEEERENESEQEMTWSQNCDDEGAIFYNMNDLYDESEVDLNGEGNTVVLKLPDNSVVEGIRCEDCQLLFRTAEYLQRHRVRMHRPATIELAKCPDCEYVAKSTKGLYEHVKAVHKFPTTNVCDCNKTFANKSSLKRHNARFHSGGSKNYECNICQRRFQLRFQLMRHIRVHNGEKPFLCECGKAYSDRANLQMHIDRIHLRKKLPCDRCSKTYWRTSDLNRHLRLAHGQPVNPLTDT